MQGKFQTQVLPKVGHAVHEDAPVKVAINLNVQQIYFPGMIRIDIICATIQLVCETLSDKRINKSGSIAVSSLL